MMTHVYPHIFTTEELTGFLESDEVVQAKETIEQQSSGSVYFTIPFTNALKEKLSSVFSIDLSQLHELPMRWIKGDTLPHVDKGSHSFDSTYLVYLTESSGQIIIGDTDYPIQAGTGYAFQEGIHHETLHTGTEPRLLLGPMSETGFAVGAAFIGGPGGSTVHLRQMGSIVEYSTNQTDWYEIYWPIYVQNTDTGLGVVTIEWLTDITLTNPNAYFVCASPNIQFGSNQLKEDGSRPKITLDGVTNYTGLIRNYQFGTTGYNTIYVYNLEVLAINGSTLDSNGAGWIGQSYYGAGATNNYIINCSSNGPIGTYCGGIVGFNAATESGAQLTLIGCSSSGAISTDGAGDYAGGIVGANAGANSGSIVCKSCWSTGVIGGTHSGGIVGGGAGYSGGSVLIQNCYTGGAITGASAGGIIGYLSRNSTIQHCYSTGVISGAYSGGIVGDGSDNSNVANCYTTGAIGVDGIVLNAGGIYGANSANYTIQQCYTSGTAANNLGYIIASSNTVPVSCYSEASQSQSGWSTSNAITVLTGIPSSGNVGTIWLSLGENVPYALRAMGYTSYSRTNIVENDLVREDSKTVSAGLSTSTGILTNSTYTIVGITNGDSGSYSTISIHPTNGTVITTSETVPGTYTVVVYRDGSYYVTILTLVVTESTNPCGCQLPIEMKHIDYEQRYGLLDGNIMLAYMNPRRPLTYDEIIKMKIAKASRS
jgi:hypothetical protein